MDGLVNQPKVFIAVLCGPERYQWIVPDLMLRLLETQHLRDITVEVRTVFGVYGYDAARNRAVEMFLQSDADWLCMIDNDNIPPADFLRHVMEFAEQFSVRHTNRPSVDIVGLPYYERPNPASPESLKLGIRWDGVRSLSPGWQEVLAVAAGCMFISRRVLHELPKPWFQIWTENIKRNFGGGEDFDFCLRARQAGFSIWANTGLLVDHYHTVSLSAAASLIRGGLGPCPNSDA